MHYDLECPYCEAGLDIGHDDGFGYQEDVKHQMECGKCGKSFVFITSISYHYEPEKADCLNDDKHDWQPTITCPKFLTKMRCSMCDEEREPTEQERINFNIPTYQDYLKENDMV